MISLPYILLSILWFSLIAYAVFGGADFGAGVWDTLAFGPNAQRQHDLIDEALGPVWETNHVWLIFLVVGLFSAFPAPFAVLVTVLYIPLTLALIGVSLRGSAFIFRTHGLRSDKPARKIWTRIFSFSSIITPFFLGLAAATVASGQIRAREGVGQVNLGAFILTPFALTIGFMAIALCATLAAIFLTVEATDKKDHELAEVFRWRANSRAWRSWPSTLSVGSTPFMARYASSCHAYRHRDNDYWLSGSGHIVLQVLPDRTSVDCR
jgi:cytochrome bd ubiquinol oxidase subunit II